MNQLEKAILQGYNYFLEHGTDIVITIGYSELYFYEGVLSMIIDDNGKVFTFKEGKGFAIVEKERERNGQ